MLTSFVGAEHCKHFSFIYLCTPHHGCCWTGLIALTGLWIVCIGRIGRIDRLCCGSVLEFNSLGDIRMVVRTLAVVVAASCCLVGAPAVVAAATDVAGIVGGGSRSRSQPREEVPHAKVIVQIVADDLGSVWFRRACSAASTQYIGCCCCRCCSLRFDKNVRGVQLQLVQLARKGCVGASSHYFWRSFVVAPW